MAAALLLAAVWHWRVKQLLSRERTLARLVAERTRELEHDKRELERARAALALKAVRDDLTGLLNRVGILDALAVQMQRSRKDGSALAVAMIDLDHFKQINDRHGHLIGDAVLARVGRRMNANLRGADLIGRYGGEELLAVLPGLLPPAHNRLYALHEVIGATPFLTDAGLLEITASIGVAWHRPGETLQQLLSRADEALYRAKHGGRNRVELHLWTRSRDTPCRAERLPLKPSRSAADTKDCHAPRACIAMAARRGGHGAAMRARPLHFRARCRTRCRIPCQLPSMTAAAHAAAEGRGMRARRPCLRTLQALLLWLALGLLLGDGARAQSIPLRRYAHDQGLLGLANTCLLQTGNGSLWVCSESGLYRFDGHRFEQVPLQGQRGHSISAASEDAEQRLWVTTFDAVYVDDGTQLRRLAPEETGVLRRNKLRLANPRWGMVLLNGPQALRAVAGTGGRWRLQPLFDAATLARLPQLGKLGEAQSEADNLWLGCDQELCRVAADGSVTVYGQAQGLPPDRWRGVVRDRDGALWLRGDHHLMQLPAAAERFVAQHPPGGAPLRQVVGQAQLLLDPQGRVLMRSGQSLLLWEHGHWRRFDRSNGLPDGGITVLLFDHAGDLWMSVDGEGVVRWNGYGWIENWDVTQGMSTAPTWSILRNSEGALLLGNEAGINRQRRADERFQHWLKDAGAQVLGLHNAADGSLWSLSALGELRHHDRQGRLLRSYPRLRVSIRRLFLDATDRVWILTTDGLYLLRPQSDDMPQRVQALPASEYSDIQQRRDGSLWLTGAGRRVPAARQHLDPDPAGAGWQAGAAVGPQAADPGRRPGLGRALQPGRLAGPARRRHPAVAAERAAGTARAADLPDTAHP
ncbi:hypothetical protein XTALMG727_0355 [Xanthomonas translucens pv. arrhenatheri LMG 727]|uniref:diguanylate cyclase n=1 Tax=Xanthomonas graminis pv. arrhenatheri LMG 727 TaxID=1195923 RepID=A0A0K2ZEW0_9XANT|nr:hypothetical protein XTALMG727_0355 [Xanthomonas translucens pv. arrhenatheri LMG 727]